jgi:hypothetical protein
MSKPAPPARDVTVTAGTQSFRVTGHAALIIALVAAHANRVNAIAVGKLVAHIANDQVKLEKRENLIPVELDWKISPSSESRAARRYVSGRLQSRYRTTRRIATPSQARGRCLDANKGSTPEEQEEW